jgi:multidrug efflux system membrane fusion protein
VPEVQVDRVEVGSPAAARLSTGREVQGRVTFLSRASDAATRTFRAEVEVANPDLALRDGQTVEIAISAEGRSAHLLPQSAMTLNDDGDLGVRVVDADNRAQFVPIGVVRDSVEGMWVTGLPDAADVIVVGQEYVTEGVPVAATFRGEAQQ